MSDTDADTDVAIVGLGGHFPGAPDADALWERVRAGDDCLVDVAPSRNEPADFVRRSGRLDGVDMFDPEFFGIPRRDAAIMDPQHRHFFECAWDALESAGHVPERFDGAIGVFGGCGMNTYLLHNLMTNPQLFDQLGWFLIRHTANDKDFLTTTLSYRLDLRGPSVNVQTACSTSLVAVHLAVQSLLGFECDLALAGGSTIEFPHGNGYVYREGEVLSASGHCRAFDARSDGTVLTSGTAVVALRRLVDAIADGDPILAVIKGSAINNDGTRKVGYLAPSVDGHADVVREALSVADIDARTITLLEAHGTGTAVGDPIEVAALTEAFRDHTTDSGYCRLVSTKPNIGHLDTAAGTASLIKVVQAMRHRTLPPIANHTAPSDLLGIDATPFTLSATADPWEVDALAGGLRRAGVSSLGVGGTNAHVIVEEAPALAPTPAAARHQLLKLSGLSGAAIDDAAARLAALLESNPDTNLADVAHTLDVGRRTMLHRRVVTVTDNASAAAQLRAPGQARVSGQAGAEAPLVAFAFPGGGAQYVGMGAGLDRERFAIFHEVRDEGIAVTKRLGGVDLAPLFEPGADAEALRQPQASLPAVFVTSVALARQWIAWGVEPDAMIGHSLGEYAAAHLAGVLSLDDALSLIVTRARLIERASAGGAAMLVVPIPEAEILPILPDGLSIATVNADDECVVAGGAEHIARFEAALLERDVQPTRIALAAAGHSALLDPILDEFAAAVRAIHLAPPTRRYVSNLTGTWITAEQVTDPQYWVDHLRKTVRFVDGLATLLDATPTVIVELGPGQSLSSYARRTGRVAGAIATLRHPDDGIDDTSFTMTAFGRLWTYGVDVDLGRFAGDASSRRKLRLPTYPFQRERCWIEPGTGSAIGGAAATGSTLPDVAPTRIESIDDMCWRPSWIDAPSAPDGAVAEFDTWTILGGSTVGDDLAIELGRRNRRVRRLTDVSELPDEDVGRELVVLAGNVADVAVDPVQRFLSDAPLVVRHLAEAAQPGRLVVLTRGALGIDAPAINPRDAMALGAVTVAPKEYPELSTALVDLDPAQVWTAELAERVVDELAAAPVVLAHRGERRLVPTVEHVPTPAPAAPAFATGSTWFITGGLGGVGYELARHLATTYAANLVIATTEPVPEGVERERFLVEHALDHPTARRIRRLAALEALGTKVVTVTADTTDARQLHDALDQAEQLVGPLDGAIHAAGRLRDRLIETSTPEDARVVIDPKVNGALALTDELERRGARTLVLISSTSTMLAPEGQLAYVAANAVLDAMAGRHGDLRVATLGFGLWSDTGMAADTAHRAALGLPDGSPIDHPVLGEIGRDERGTITISGRIDARHHWVVDEHRTTADVAILPGTGHLELFIAAARAAGHDTVRLSEIALLEPLVVADDRPVNVRVVIDGNTIRLDSDEGTGSAWTTHSEATLSETGAVDVPPEPFDVDDALARCTLDGIDPFGASRDLLHVGPRWNPIADAARTETEGAARLRLEIRPEDCTVWSAHPALVDVVTGLGVTLAADTQRLHVPVGYDRVVWFDRVPSDCHVAARRPLATDRERDLGVIRIDLTIADATGRVVMQIDGLQLRPIDAPAALGAPQHADAPAAARVGGLLAITDMIGLHPDEGTALLDRLVGGDTDRLIVSSVDLETLREFGTPDEPTAEHAAPTAPASGSLEDVLAAMWSDLLGVSPIAHDADFFDLGGHSLIAIRLMSRIKRDLGVRFQLSTIFDASTVNALAARIREEHPEVEAALLGQASDETHSAAAATAQSSGKRHLVTISAAGPGAPLFVVHGAGGNVLFLWSLARALAGERPIHGFQAHGIDGDDMPDGSVEQMATRYVAELRAKQPGPYLLAGYSGGGIVALEMVRQLQQAGEEVTHVILFDSVPSGRAWPTRAERWRNVTRHAIRHGVGSVKPFVRMMVVSTVRRFIPERQHQTEEHEQQSRALGYQDVGDHGFVNLFHYFSATADRYQLGTYDLDVTVLKADLVWPAQPEDYYWTPHITGTLAVHPVPGDHHSMFFPENVPRLAAVVREVLATIETPSE